MYAYQNQPLTLNGLIQLRDELSSAIQLLTRLYKEDGTLDLSRSESISPNPDSPILPYAHLKLWEAAQIHLQQVKQPQSLQTITIALQVGGAARRAIRLSGSVHGAMKLKPAIFKAHGNGLWGLTSWDTSDHEGRT